MADDPTITTTDNSTTFTPVVSTDLISSLVNLFNVTAARDAALTANIQASTAQHMSDQQALAQQQAQLAIDSGEISADSVQIEQMSAQHDADAGIIDKLNANVDKLNASITAAQANQVSPAIISSIDAAANAIASGQPLPPFPDAPAPSLPVTVGSTLALPTDPSDPSSPTVDHTVTGIAADGTISAAPVDPNAAPVDPNAAATAADPNAAPATTD